jgi:hypothetical protein
MKLKSKFLTVFFFISTVIYSQPQNIGAQEYIEEVLKDKSFKKDEFTFGSQRYGNNISLKQFFNIRYEIIPQKILPADSLNFIQWKGKVILKFDAVRKIDGWKNLFNTWEEWKKNDSLEVNFIKKRNQWSFPKYRLDNLFGQHKPNEVLVNKALLRPMIDSN